ncbi:MAG: S8 family serine peptidase, partial [Candidatus Sumerlaeia bacterium]|nr:S8 family serine peptidase [Candidatus Sumerlaeia bacterium]
MLRPLLTTCLIFTASLLPGSGFHGIALEDIVASAGKTTDTVGEVMLLPSGLRGLSMEAAARGISLEGHLDMAGLEFIGSVGPDAALVVPREGEKSRAGMNLVPLAPDHRLAPSLRDKSIQRSEWRLVIHAAGGGDLAADIAEAFPDAEIAGTVERGRSIRAALRIHGDEGDALVAWLSRRGDVYSVMEALPPRLYNTTARRWVQSGTSEPGGETLWGRGLRGEGQVIAVLDTGADWLNCHLAEPGGTPPPVLRAGDPLVADMTRRKIIAYQILPGSMKDDAMDNQGHGTLVAGNALGREPNGTMEPGSTNHDGVAPAAQLVVQDGGYQGDECGDIPALGCPVLGVLHFLEDARHLGAMIHNNSWGDQEEADVQNVYTNISADMDLMTWTHPDFLIVCAAGNFGARGDESVSSPSTGKNVLSIAATDNPDATSMTTFSSRGWTNDDRIKPDLAAPG